MRISRDEWLMAMAHLTALRSTCLRLQVGAVIARHGRIMSTGYAGAPSGLPHCTPETCNETTPCTNTAHAEIGAITFAAREGIAVGGSTLYCTHSPCKPCAQSIINAGITKVIYDHKYRKTEGIETLEKAGVAVTRLELPAMPSVGELRESLFMGQRNESEDNDYLGSRRYRGRSQRGLPQWG